MDEHEFIDNFCEEYMIVKLKVIPNAKNNAIVDVGKYIKIKISEKPHNGKANMKLIEFLEGIFGCNVELISGLKSRYKTVKIFCKKKDFIKKLKELGYV